MKIAFESSSLKRTLLRIAAGSVAAMGLTSMAAADSSAGQAPPIQSDPAQVSTEQSKIDQTTVFDWTQVPANQTVTINKASFDKGGYQLYDTVGDTILVPFANNNLYVMKFARSNDGSMFFVNDGNSPVLYLPTNGYLENATVPGARWYPFTSDFQPAQPVYIGIAPSWDDFVFMGWFPDTICTGGYYCDIGFGGGQFIPCPGSGFTAGGHRYYGWDEYQQYCLDHAPPYRTQFFDHHIYGRPGGESRTFPQTALQHDGPNYHPYVSTPHDFGNAGRPVTGPARTYSFDDHSYEAYRGDTSSNSQPFGSDSGSFGGGWEGGDHSFGGGGHSFGGGGRGGR